MRRVVNLSSIIRGSVWLVFGIALGGFFGEIVTSRRERLASQRVVAAEALPPTVWRTEELGTLNREALARHGPGLVVVLLKADLETCEDLGRQLRELLRRHDKVTSLGVFTTTFDSSSVSQFLRSERVAVRKLLTVETLQSLHSSSTEFPTPSAMLASHGGVPVAGVSYETGVAGSRLESFADALAPAMESLVVKK